jgi:hypothetical protein
VARLDEFSGGGGREARKLKKGGSLRDWRSGDRLGGHEMVDCVDGSSGDVLFDG